MGEREGLFLRLRQVGYSANYRKNEDLHQVLLMNRVINTILESEGPSSLASYPIHMHSEPAKYVQVCDVVDINICIRRCST